jgi:UDPglucose 6-dehydrogenase
MTEAPSIYIIKELIQRGATIRAYDPKATFEAQNCYLKGLPVEYCSSKYDAIKEADALILLTEWREFQLPDFFEIKKSLRAPVIFDGRNQYGKLGLEEKGFEYYQIGVKHE